MLTLFLTHPADEYYLRELARRTRSSVGSLQNELRRLERLGLLESRRVGRVKFYRANESHPLYPDLKRIVYKTTALGDVVRAAVGGVPGVEASFIYGSVAKGREGAVSDIDLFVLGIPDQDRLHEALRGIEEGLGREVSLVVMGRDEWQQRLERRDSFVMELRRSPKIMVVGDERALLNA